MRGAAPYSRALPISVMKEAIFRESIQHNRRMRT